MYSRIELAIAPSLSAGLLASLPWQAMALLILVAGASGTALSPLLALPALAGAGWQVWHSGLLRSRRAVVALVVDNGQLYTRHRDGRQQAVTVAPESRLSAGLVLLKLTVSGTISRKYLVVLTSAGPQWRNSDPDSFRRLRVWLRLGNEPYPRQAG